MSSSKQPSQKSSKKSDSYHHGDLRRALIEAAYEILKEAGVSGLSLRAVTRRAGVSHASAYHHFDDKTGLMAAVAVAGFEDLAKVTEVVHGRGDLSALERFKRLAQVYVAFAVENPHVFRLMFLPELRSDSVRTEVEQAGRADYAKIVSLVAQLQDEGRVAAGDPEAVAISAWGMMHGLATLMIDGPLYRNAKTPASREAVVERAVGHLLGGVLEP